MMPNADLNPGPLLERILPRLEWNGDCLIATGRTVPLRFRYGQVHWKGRTYRVTRLVWASVHGWESIEGLEVRHTCDNPPCCNLEHLTPGTHLQNMQDKKPSKPRATVSSGKEASTCNESPTSSTPH